MYVCSIDTCTCTGAHVPVLELCWSLHVHVISHVGKMRRELKLETIKNVILVEIRICYRSAFNFKYLYIDSLNKYKQAIILKINQFPYVFSKQVVRMINRMSSCMYMCTCTSYQKYLQQKHLKILSYVCYCTLAILRTANLPTT